MEHSNGSKESNSNGSGTFSQLPVPERAQPWDHRQYHPASTDSPNDFEPQSGFVRPTSPGKPFWVNSTIGCKNIIGIKIPAQTSFTG